MKRITVNNLVEYLARIDRCENMAQVCFVFDHMPIEVKKLIEKKRDSVEGRR